MMPHYPSVFCTYSRIVLCNRILWDSFVVTEELFFLLYKYCRLVITFKN
uniref:Uncharacterized protein n=1 Tax=Rhizophora mucronata TaxID=61149 RepID=A0A2P2PQ16_RHIMU